MIKWIVVCLLAAGLFATPAQAAVRLSCQLQTGQVLGVEGQPKITEFLWSSAHGLTDPTGPIATSIGAIDQREPTSTLTLNGVALALSPEFGGQVRFGQAYDFGDQVALAYLVERADDSSAAPSQVALLLDNAGGVLATDLIPGNADLADGQCLLIN